MHYYLITMVSILNLSIFSSSISVSVVRPNFAVILAHSVSSLGYFPLFWLRKVSMSSLTAFFVATDDLHFVPCVIGSLCISIREYLYVWFINDSHSYFCKSNTSVDCDLVINMNFVYIYIYIHIYR